MMYDSCFGATRGFEDAFDDYAPSMETVLQSFSPRQEGERVLSILKDRLTQLRRTRKRFSLSRVFVPVLLSAMVGLTMAWIPGQPVPQKATAPQKFDLHSTAFRSGGDIPKKFTCEGADVSPALTWDDPPAGTQSFALIADDPDAPAGTWVHWVAFDLPGSTRQLAEGMPKVEDLAGGGPQGVNDFGSAGYGGPCPPPGKPHRYFFKLYALDTKLKLKTGATKQAVERAMEGHILAEAQLMGRYKRP